MGNPLPSVVPPGPDNPLGSHVLKLAMPGYLIHGTNQPYGVGMRVSHGCVRLYPENIELLYSVVAVGEPVRIINEPYLLGWRNGELYFEAHPPLEDDAMPAEERLEALLDGAEADPGECLPQLTRLELERESRRAHVARLLHQRRYVDDAQVLPIAHRVLADLENPRPGIDQ